MLLTPGPTAAPETVVPMCLCKDDAGRLLADIERESKMTSIRLVDQEVPTVNWPLCPTRLPGTLCHPDPRARVPSPARELSTWNIDCDSSILAG